MLFLPLYISFMGVTSNLVNQELPPKTFFGGIVLIPIASLFWSMGVGFFHWNWFPLIFFPVCTAWVLLSVRSFNLDHLLFFGVFIFYTILFPFNEGDYLSVLRIFTSLLPLLFIKDISNYSRKINKKTFWGLFFLSLSLPLILSIMQLIGKFPFYDSGKALWIVERGRISGGYSKPNNLIIYFFPALLYGISIYKKYRVIGLLIIIVCLFLSLTSTLRISIIIYTAVLLSSFFPQTLNRLVVLYYKYCVPIIVSLVGLIILSLSFDLLGPHLALRERLPVWQAHANSFLNADISTIAFGKSSVQLESLYQAFPEVLRFDEAHNNSIRIIVTFGVIGFFAYSLFMRRIVLFVNTAYKNPYLANCCFLSYALYSITNEPAFYPSIFWCTMVWALIKD